MTDKQIIIDGVDVSMCEFLTKTGHCKAQMSIIGIDANKCKCFPNCYYKQLKVKEQEYDKLKTENEKLRNFHINLVGVKECDIRELLKLKQTLAEIKEIAKNSCCLQPTSDCEEYEN